MYDSSFTITEPVSNNEFSFDKRKKIPGLSPTLTVPALIHGNPTDLKPGNKIVFEDMEDEQLVSCNGLKNFIKTSFGPKQLPVYIFDNHNHSFYFWHHERNKGNLAQQTALIHIDQHKDTRQPRVFFTEEDSYNDQKLFNFTNEILNVGNFIPPAIKTGLISEVINIESEQSLDLPSKKIPKSFILDIDIDFFSPEMDYIDSHKKMATIKRLLPLAQLITVATSPFFIDQKRAIQVVKEIFS